MRGAFLPRSMPAIAVTGRRLHLELPGLCGISSLMKRSYTELISRLRVVEASSPHVRMEELGEFALGDKSYSLYRIALAADPPGPIKVCISTGIHGDEPAGPEAVTQFLERNADNEALLKTFSFTIFPCDNPSGYAPLLRHHPESEQTLSAYVPA